MTTLYDEYRAALAMLRALAYDLTDEGEQLFTKWLHICHDLKDAIIKIEQEK